MDDCFSVHSHVATGVASLSCEVLILELPQSPYAHVGLKLLLASASLQPLGALASLSPPLHHCQHIAEREIVGVLPVFVLWSLGAPIPLII